MSTSRSQLLDFSGDSVGFDSFSETGVPLGCYMQVEAIKIRGAFNPNSRRKLAMRFKVLSHDTSLRLIHTLLLRTEMSVNKLSEELEMKPQAVSNQLQRLLDQKIVQCRREGKMMYYSVIDSFVTQLLDLGSALLFSTPNMKRGR
jgi:DNA-binding transcriptional ArsR family regulator